MPTGHAVVDGSNIATEGRSEPNLAQLNEAVEAFRDETDFEHLTVIVDASFEYRVSDEERDSARTAIAANEIITAPAGVIGRGDAFILKVADRANAVVLSNDSFQEFHATYPWLFDEGRLIGGKPITGLGWVYVPRSPVRGPVSRRAAQPETDDPKPIPTKPAEISNTAEAWTSFFRQHPVGSSVPVTVESFSPQGAYGQADGVTIYLPRLLLADPAPRRSRDTVGIGETHEMIIHRYDEDRRSIDAGLVPIADPPPVVKTTVTSPKKAAAKKATAKKAPAKKAATKKTRAKKAAAKKAPSPKR